MYYLLQNIMRSSANILIGKFWFNQSSRLEFEFWRIDLCAIKTIKYPAVIYFRGYYVLVKTLKHQEKWIERGMVILKKKIRFFLCITGNFDRIYRNKKLKSTVETMCTIGENQNELSCTDQGYLFFFFTCVCMQLILCFKINR